MTKIVTPDKEQQDTPSNDTLLKRVANTIGPVGTELAKANMQGIKVAGKIEAGRLILDRIMSIGSNMLNDSGKEYMTNPIVAGVVKLVVANGLTALGQTFKSRLSEGNQSIVDNACEGIMTAAYCDTLQKVDLGTIVEKLFTSDVLAALKG